MREHFKEYNDVWGRIKELRLKLETIEHDIYDIKGMKYTDMPRVTAPKDALLIMIAEKDEIEKELKAEQDKLLRLKKKHLKEIAKVNDLKYRSILRSYYLDRVRKEDIASASNITIGHFYKLRREAIDAFKRANGLDDTK